MHPLLEAYFKFIKRTVLSRPEDTVIGLDIGASACRALELRRKQDGFEVVSRCVQSMDGMDERTALAQAIAKLGPSARTSPVIVAVSGKGTLIRHIDMPRMSSADLNKAFAMEADKYFPFPRDTVYIDCFILDPKGKDKKMPVLIAAVKRDIVDARCKLLKDCGIEPAALTLSSVALANAFTAFPPSTCAITELGGKAVAVIDVGELSTNLMIIADGMPRFTRDIFIGTMDAARRLANMTGLSVGDARALCLKGVAADGNAAHAAALKGSMEAVLTSIVAEIRLSFDYFTTEKNMPISRVCLTGEGACVPGAEAVFAQHIDIPLVAWDPLAGIPVAKTTNGPSAAGDMTAEDRRMVVALGLALL